MNLNFRFGRTYDVLGDSPQSGTRQKKREGLWLTSALRGYPLNPTSASREYAVDKGGALVPLPWMGYLRFRMFFIKFITGPSKIVEIKATDVLMNKLSHILSAVLSFVNTRSRKETTNTTIKFITNCLFILYFFNAIFKFVTTAGDKFEAP